MTDGYKTAASFVGSIFKVTLQNTHVHMTQQEQQLMCDVHVNKLFFFLRFIAKKVCTACSRANNKIVPLTNLNKYLYNDKSEYK